MFVLKQVDNITELNLFFTITDGTNEFSFRATLPSNYETLNAEAKLNAIEAQINNRLFLSNITNEEIIGEEE